MNASHKTARAVGALFLFTNVTFGLGALTFYYCLYHLELMPPLVSIWGLVGAALVLVNLLADWFGVTLPNLGLFMLANELFLGVWLIVKGFARSAVPSAVATTAPA